MKTYGYDLVFALTLERANKILGSNRPPVDFSFSTIDRQTGSNVAMTGRMGAWQFVTGGQNKLLRMKIPFVGGSLTVSALDETFDLAGIQVIVEISLAWMGAGGGLATHGDHHHARLAFNLDSTADEQDASGGRISVAKILSDKTLNPLCQGILMTSVPELLYTNKKDVQIILAQVVPDQADTSAWMHLKSWDYFYTQNDAGRGFICILCMSESNLLPATPGFDASAFSDDCDCIVLIEEKLFLKNVIYPAVKDAYSGSFGFKGDNEKGWSIVNQGNIKVGNFTASNFDSLIDSSYLSTALSGSGREKKLGSTVATYNWSYSCKNKVRFDATAQTVDFIPDPGPKKDYDYKKTTWGKIYDVLNMIAGAVDPIYALCDTVLNSAGGVNLTKINNSLQHNFASDVVHIANLVSWSDASFKANDAGLSSAFYIRGNLNPKVA